MANTKISVPETLAFEVDTDGLGTLIDDLAALDVNGVRVTRLYANDNPADASHVYAVELAATELAALINQHSLLLLLGKYRVS